MENSGLISTVVEIFVGAASGAASTIGQGAGTAVVDLVRRQLGDSEEGETALTNVTSNPTDPASANALRSLLAHELDSNSDFHDKIVRALADPQSSDSPQSYSHSVVIGGSSRVRNSHISLGPLTINNTRGSRISLAVLGAVAVALISLGGYGAVRLISDSGNKSTDSGNSSVTSSGRAEKTPPRATPKSGSKASDPCIAAGGTPPHKPSLGAGNIRSGSYPCILDAGKSYAYSDGLTLKVDPFKRFYGTSLDGQPISIRTSQVVISVRVTVLNASSKHLVLGEDFSSDGYKFVSVEAGDNEYIGDYVGGSNHLDSSSGTLAPGQSKTFEYFQAIDPEKDGKLIRLVLTRSWTPPSGSEFENDVAWDSSIPGVN
ncbi:hypothetical protein [Streptomyces sp. NPDC059371]|uniref:hypothetical protein n=1 Tax=Streptomyces sp. NPDC059371 TaxID=3346812 RepID=UPI0036B57FFC